MKQLKKRQISNFLTEPTQFSEISPLSTIKKSSLRILAESNIWLRSMLRLRLTGLLRSRGMILLEMLQRTHRGRNKRRLSRNTQRCLLEHQRIEQCLMLRRLLLRLNRKLIMVEMQTRSQIRDLSYQGKFKKPHPEKIRMSQSNKFKRPQCR